ncbi:MAG: hypothetical protein AAF449_16850 [Myxococcota bacterium]
MATPTELATVIDENDRYETLGLLIEGFNAPRSQRLAASRLLYRQCSAAAAYKATSTNHMLASIAGSVYSALLYHDDPIQARFAAQHAFKSGKAAGHHSAQLWAAAAWSACARRLDDTQGAIDAIESVVDLNAERGTRGVFAATCLAEAYGDAGDAEGVRRSLELGSRLRDSVATDDEFAGMLFFSPEKERAHRAEALLGCGHYVEAVKYAGRSLEGYAKMPESHRLHGYMRFACITIAAASTRLGWFDQTEEYANRAVDRPLEPLFKPLQVALAQANAPRLAAHIRDAVQLS